MINQMTVQTKLNSFCFYIMSTFLIALPQLTFAESDPFTKAGNKGQTILFGALGLSLCMIFIGGAFLSAKMGRCTWDRFVNLMLYAAGFLGTPSIVLMIKGLVS